MIHPKEKAEELVNKFHKFTYTAVHAHKTNGEYADAKECAFIAIDEIINILKETVYYKQETFNYWLKVKEEINNLKEEENIKRIPRNFDSTTKGFDSITKKLPH
jgi:hypothetical protein